MMSSNPDGIAQFGNMIRRDRNHPSVFLWSMGNEENIAPTEIGFVSVECDEAVASSWTTHVPSPSRRRHCEPQWARAASVCDVMGYNYADPPAEAVSQSQSHDPRNGHGERSAPWVHGACMSLIEQGLCRILRSVHHNRPCFGGRLVAVRKRRPWLAGGFVWTGFDYRGEPSPYPWPNTGSQYGVIDLCGFPKDTFFYYRVWWTQSRFCTFSRTGTGRGSKVKRLRFGCTRISSKRRIVPQWSESWRRTCRRIHTLPGM